MHVYKFWGSRIVVHEPIRCVDSLKVLTDKTVVHYNKMLYLIMDDALSRARDRLLISELELK